MPYSAHAHLLHDRDRPRASRRPRDARDGHYPDGARQRPASFQPADAAARALSGDCSRAPRHSPLSDQALMPVHLTRIYTRGGDRGETSLVDGTRVRKHALRVEAYGTVDEANAVIGLARLHAEGAVDEMLARIQNDLFDLGADLGTPAAGRKAEGALRIVPAQVERLEREIDAMNEKLT